MSQTQLVSVIQRFFAESSKITQNFLDQLDRTNNDYSKNDDSNNHQSQVSQVSSKKSRQKKIKSIKDPLAPKKPMSSFFHFCKEKRPIYALKFKDEKLTEIIKKVADGWKSMNDEKKQPYEKQAQEDKRRYDREMNLYLQNKTSNNQQKQNKSVCKITDPESTQNEEYPIKRLKK